MSGTNISELYSEFTHALTEVLAENAVGPARRGPLARARAAVKKHPEYNEHAYFLAVETAFINWETVQNIGR
jgi:molybdopterin-guanine dinucleotide biosynthesis protein A